MANGFGLSGMGGPGYRRSWMDDVNQGRGRRMAPDMFDRYNPFEGPRDEGFDLGKNPYAPPEGVNRWDVGEGAQAEAAKKKGPGQADYMRMMQMGMQMIPGMRNSPPIQYRPGQGPSAFRMV